MLSNLGPQCQIFGGDKIRRPKGCHHRSASLALVVSLFEEVNAAEGLSRGRCRVAAVSAVVLDGLFDAVGNALKPLEGNWDAVKNPLKRFEDNF